MYATQDEPFQTSSLGNAPNNRISLQKKRRLVYFLTRGTNYLYIIYIYVLLEGETNRGTATIRTRYLILFNKPKVMRSKVAILRGTIHPFKALLHTSEKT